jgi:hypothetical protein
MGNLLAQSGSTIISGFGKLGGIVSGSLESETRKTAREYIVHKIDQKTNPKHLNLELRKKIQRNSYVSATSGNYIGKASVSAVPGNNNGKAGISAVNLNNKGKDGVSSKKENSIKLAASGGSHKKSKKSNS